MSDELSTALHELAADNESFPALSGAEVRGRAVRRGRRRMAGVLGAGAVACTLVAFALTVGFTHSAEDGNGRQLPAATHAEPVPSPRVPSPRVTSPRVTSPEVVTPVPRASVTGTVVLGKRALIVGGRVMPMTSGLPDSPEPTGPLTVYKKHETKVVTVTDLTGGVAYTTTISLAVELRDVNNEPVYVGIAFSSKEKSTGEQDTGAGWIGLDSADAKWFYEDAKIGSVLAVTGATS
ncbi:hypothetical protein [Streptomyces sp. N50]|uniref:hypothetical protein n=1 Tax=Streptomyces sp. N50 TaxID=3081765 RepID=UPI002961F873|nr:hypothetical protein [Streptomyces sp. N50]WOX11214.1 hypothetical protein R2B38_21360 [Streptomyces sp. N50]